MDSCRGTAGRRGFSLIEMLLAVFILAIGIIGVSAIFPAGIAQQRAAQDDTFGPLVSESAMSVIRGKVRVRDFGSFEQFQDGAGSPSPDFVPTATGPQQMINPVTLATMQPTMVPQGYRPLVGDWRWKRPTIIFQDSIAGLTPSNGYYACVDVFGAALWETVNVGTPPGYTARVSQSNVRCDTALGGYPASAQNPGRCYGIPWNIDAQSRPPWALITQRERTWPQGAAYNMASGGGTAGAPANQKYLWDCMFRRKGGRIQVAVFVYRVTAPGGEALAYTTPENSIVPLPSDPLGGPTPPYPRSVVFPSNERWVAAGATTAMSVVLPGTNPNTGPGNWNLSTDAFAWQAPGQWILDPYGNVHKLTRGRRNRSEGPCRLSATLPSMPASAANFPYGWTSTNSGTFDPSQVDESRVDQIWFMPNFDSAGNTITPVYIGVQEL